MRALCKVCSRPCDKIGEINNIGFTKSFCCNDFIIEFGREIPKCDTCNTCNTANDKPFLVKDGLGKASSERTQVKEGSQLAICEECGETNCEQLEYNEGVCCNHNNDIEIHRGCPPCNEDKLSDMIDTAVDLEKDRRFQ